MCGQPARTLPLCSKDSVPGYLPATHLDGAWRGPPGAQVCIDICGGHTEDGLWSSHGKVFCIHRTSDCPSCLPSLSQGSGSLHLPSWVSWRQDPTPELSFVPLCSSCDPPLPVLTGVIMVSSVSQCKERSLLSPELPSSHRQHGVCNVADAQAAKMKFS